MENKYQSRKFWLTVGSVIIFTMLLTFGKMDDNVYENLVMAIVMSYLAANVVQKATVKENKA